MSRLAIVLLPYRWLAPRLGVASTAAPHTSVLNDDQERFAAALGRTIGHVARRTPWRSNCFAQALTAQFFLRRRGIPSVLLLGVARSPCGTLQAHAWMMAGSRCITGGADAPRYTVVGCYVASRARHAASS